VGMQRRPPMAGVASVRMSGALSFTTHPGDGGFQGLCSLSRSSRINSQLVAGTGPVILKGPGISGDSIDLSNIALRSLTRIQLMY
jgi:hypothetical protein